jgi:hypothetical protein
MAKKRSSDKENKSQRIRDYLKKHRKARNVDVAAALTAEGLPTTANYVAIVKGKMKKRRRRRREAVARGAAPRPARLGMEHVTAAASFIKSAGGIKGAKAALAAAEQLAKVLS